MQERSKTYNILFAIAIMLTFASCKSGTKSEFTGNLAFGKTSKIVVLGEQDLWESEVGDSLRYYYESAYPVLPQPEPMFDILFRTTKDLIQKPMNKQLRTFLIFADVSDTSAYATKMLIKDIGSVNVSESLAKRKYGVKTGKNKWAQDQLLIYIYGQSPADLIDGIVRTFPTISKRFYDFDTEMIEANIFGGQNNFKLEMKIKEKYGFNIRIPSGWVKAIDKGDFLWLRNERERSSNSLVFYKTAYTDPKQFSKSEAIALRDKVTRKYIASMSEGSAMHVDSINLPVFYYSNNVDNQYGIEIRGIWNMENDFKGGPFSTFLIHNEAKNEVLMVDGFVFAPGENKRNLMRQLNHIIGTVSF